MPMPFHDLDSPALRQQMRWDAGGCRRVNRRITNIGRDMRVIPFQPPPKSLFGRSRLEAEYGSDPCGGQRIPCRVSRVPTTCPAGYSCSVARSSRSAGTRTAGRPCESWVAKCPAGGRARVLACDPCSPLPVERRCGRTGKLLDRQARVRIACITPVTQGGAKGDVRGVAVGTG